MPFVRAGNSLVLGMMVLAGATLLVVLTLWSGFRAAFQFGGARKLGACSSRGRLNWGGFGWAIGIAAVV